MSMFNISKRKPNNVKELNQWIQRQGKGTSYCIMDKYCTPESIAEDCTEFYVMGDNNGLWNTIVVLESIDDVISYFADGIYDTKESAIIKRDWA